MVPAIDRAAGRRARAVRVAVGAHAYDTIREAFARESSEHTMTPFRDPEFSRQQSEKIRALIAQRTKELPPRDYVEMIRSAIKEDEWMLYLHGGGDGPRRRADPPGDLRMTELEPEPRGQSLVPGSRAARGDGVVAHDRMDRDDFPQDFPTAAGRGDPRPRRPESSSATSAGAARDLLGMTDLEDRVRSAAPSTDGARKVAEIGAGGRGGAAGGRLGVGGRGRQARRRDGGVAGHRPQAGGQPDERRNGGRASLRSRGEELLHKSRDVRYEEDAHPAYERLLDSLAPDEARILRLMLLDGPQPAVDIRTGGPLGLVSSRLIAPGLSMIGAAAGLRYVERVPAYLNNLNRLGLIWFSRETLRDPLRYQVLEAQPDVLEAIHSVRQAKIVRRSIHLTPFGEGFCRASLVPDPQLLAGLPEHASPEKPRRPQPPAASTVGASGRASAHTSVREPRAGRLSSWRGVPGLEHELQVEDPRAERVELHPARRPRSTGRPTGGRGSRPRKRACR